MICSKCGNKMVIKNNPKYKIPNIKGEPHLIIECENCKQVKETQNK